MQTIFEAAGGYEGLLKLAGAWHKRVLADEVVSHAFSHGYHAEHTERLAAYWAEALGGPTTYSDRYGDETAVVRMHSGNGPHEEMDRRAIGCFDRALEDVGFDRDERLRRVLHDYFAWATTTTMARYHHSADDVPGGLQIPKWSWQGLLGGGGSNVPGSAAKPRFESVTPRVPVENIEEALEFYRDELGFDLGWKWGTPVTHASVCRDSISLDLISVPAGRRGTAMAYIQVAGVDAYYEELLARGVRLSDLGDREYGMRDFEVVDPSGNRLAFGEPLAFGGPTES